MILAVGDESGSVRTYRVREDGQSALNEEIEGPGDPILSLHIRDHWMVAGTSTSVVRLWRLSNSAECRNLRTLDFRGRVNRKDTTIKRLMNVALFFDDLLRPVERFEPRCCGFHADRDQSGGEDDDDKNDHDKGSGQEIQEPDSESHEGPPRLQFVEPQSEPEPRDDQILLLVSQCLTTDSEADRRGTNIAHPLRYRMLRAL